MKEYLKEERYNKHEVILFNSHSKSESVVLSNFYPCTINDNGITFNSSEQLFQYLLFPGNEKVQKEILNSETPYGAQQVAKYYKHECHKSIWEQVDIMKYCLESKRDQCPEFFEYLKKHPKEVFVEYAPWGDTFWGMTDENPKLKFDWKHGVIHGRNAVGVLIGNIRDRYFRDAKYSEYYEAHTGADESDDDQHHLYFPITIEYRVKSDIDEHAVGFLWADNEYGYFELDTEFSGDYPIYTTEYTVRRSDYPKIVSFIFENNNNLREVESFVAYCMYEHL